MQRQPARSIRCTRFGCSFAARSAIVADAHHQISAAEFVVEPARATSLYHLIGAVARHWAGQYFPE
jgi:hypothetical protein